MNETASSTAEGVGNPPLLVCSHCGAQSRGIYAPGELCGGREPDESRCGGTWMRQRQPRPSPGGPYAHSTEETTHPVTVLRQGEEPETEQHPATVTRLIVTAPAHGEWPEIGELPPGEVELRQDLLTEFQQSGLTVGSLVTEKNAAYGGAFFRAGEFLRLLYPDGIRPEQYADAICLVRIFDKQMRIATDRDALGESPYQDIAGYGLLGMALSQKAPPDGS